jgi:hypothetical protein
MHFYRVQNIADACPSLGLHASPPEGRPNLINTLIQSPEYCRCLSSAGPASPLEPLTNQTLTITSAGSRITQTPSALLPLLRQILINFKSLVLLTICTRCLNLEQLIGFFFNTCYSPQVRVNIKQLTLLEKYCLNFQQSQATVPD